MTAGMARVRRRRCPVLLCPVLLAAGLVVIGAAARADEPEPLIDPAVRLCEHLIREAVRTRSTYIRETVAFGRPRGGRAFTRITFTALAQNGYHMHGKAECRFDDAPATAREAARCPTCTHYTFHSFVFDGEDLVLPQPSPRISSTESALPARDG